MTENKKEKVVYRGKYISVVIQPKVDSNYWLQYHSDKEIEKTLMFSGFPLWTEIVTALKNAKTKSLKGHERVAAKWAFGTEVGDLTFVPHYQIYMEFDVIINRMALYESLDALLQGRAHIITKVVYTNSFKDYCLKETSNFHFTSNYYWNVKKDSVDSEFIENRMLKLRPKLNMISENLMTGQKLLSRIATGTPDDRTGIWLADVIGGTGKTAFFQTIVDDHKANGVYLRIADGMERLSSKLRKKISKRLSEGRGYPRFIWINFGRTLTEESLRIFADFGEQILDGMLDDNFGNSSEGDFMALPYVNLIITANTPPNLKQLTGDRLKLLTLFPVYDVNDNYKLLDTLLVPIYVEIKVRFMKENKANLEYKYVVKVQDEHNTEESFSQFEWFGELLENRAKYQSYILSDRYAQQKYQSKLESPWIATTPYNLQQDILTVYYKALAYSTTIASKDVYIEASSFNYPPKSYTYKDAIQKDTFVTSYDKNSIFMDL